MDGRKGYGTISLVLALAVLVAAGGSSEAEITSLSLGPAAGTTGLGLEGVIGIGDNIGLRLSHSLLSGAQSLSWRSIPYRFDASMNWTSILLDVNPGGGAFRISGGAVISTGDIGILVESDEPLELGGVTYTPAQLGTVTGSIEMNPAAPYLGVGFENRPESGRGLVFNTDIGIVVQSYRVTMEHRGGGLPISMEQDLLEAIEAESGELEDDLNSVGVYPVIRLSLVLRI